jgi:hypothetical protein
MNYWDGLKVVATQARKDMKELGWPIDRESVLEFLASRVHEDLREEMFQMPFINDAGYVEYEGKAWFFDWSGDLAYAPIEWRTGEPDMSEGVVCKACDDAEPISDELTQEIIDLIPD